MKLETHNVEETLALGVKIGQAAAALPGPVTIALDGPLGAGKTHLTRGIAQGAAVADLSLVCSPTYVILNIYQAPKPLYHFDAYRVKTAEEFEELGFDEILRSDGITIVEWAARIAELLPADTLWITIEHADEGHRILELKAGGEKARNVLEKL